MFLMELAGLLEVRVVRDRDHELVNNPVATHVLHRAKVPERNGEHRAAMVPQFDGSEREGLDRSLVAAALDVLADAERIVEEKKIPLMMSLTTVWAPNPTATLRGRRPRR